MINTDKMREDYLHPAGVMACLDVRSLCDEVDRLRKVLKIILPCVSRTALMCMSDPDYAAVEAVQKEVKP